jgi:hypothetical protein
VLQRERKRRKKSFRGFPSPPPSLSMLLVTIPKILYGSLIIIYFGRHFSPARNTHLVFHFGEIFLATSESSLDDRNDFDFVQMI